MPGGTIGDGHRAIGRKTRAGETEARAGRTEKRAAVLGEMEGGLGADDWLAMTMAVYKAELFKTRSRIVREAFDINHILEMEPKSSRPDAPSRQILTLHRTCVSSASMTICSIAIMSAQRCAVFVRTNNCHTDGNVRG